MVGRIVILVILIGVIGWVVGYLIFGRIGGDYLSVKQIFQPAENVIQDIARTVTGIQDARRNIWISAAVGAGLGLVVGAVSGRRR